MNKKILGATIFAVASITAPTFAAADSNTVVVKAGDTLWGISKSENVSVDQIKKLNNLKNNTIFPGQKLIVRESSGGNTNPSVGTKYSKVTAEWLNVRKGPGVSHSIVDTLKKNTEVKVGAKSNNWTKIEFGNKTGYVNANYLSNPYTKGSNPNPGNGGGNDKPGDNNKPGTNDVIHTVVSGDSLWAISVKYNVTVNHIKKLNNLSSNIIHVGNKLTIIKGSEDTTPPPSNNDGGKEVTTTHKVIAGETLWGISNKYNVTVNEIKEWNGLENNTIVTGQTLIVSKTTVVDGDLPGTGTPSTKTFDYTVTYGDSLSMIANKYGTTVEQIKLDNNLTSNTIYPNQVIKLDVSNVSALFIKPADGRVTSEYGPRWGRTHAGIDIAQAGENPVVAGADGVVTRSNVGPSYGEVVIVEHNINGKVYTTVYAHMRPSSRTVSVGDTVKEGEVLGIMGNTGNSTGQHLHFEVHIGKYSSDMSSTVNPRLFIKW